MKVISKRMKQKHNVKNSFHKTHETENTKHFLKCMKQKNKKYKTVFVKHETTKHDTIFLKRMK